VSEVVTGLGLGLKDEALRAFGVFCKVFTVALALGCVTIETVLVRFGLGGVTTALVFCGAVLA
jgi:hypothetical protein